MLFGRHRGARPERSLPLPPVAAVAWAAALLLMGSALAQTIRAPELVATIPHPGFLENLTERSDGSIYITAAFDRIIWKVGRDRTVEQFTQLPEYAVILGIAPLKEGFVVAAFRRNFVSAAGIDFSDLGSVLLLLDRAGHVTSSIDGERGAAFNGLVADGRGKYLIADSHLPVIWQFDPVSRKISEWLRDEAALTPPSARDIGGDGLKVAGNAVYVSNKTTLSVYKVERAADGRPKGALTLVAKQLPTADDFAVTEDGTLYVPAPEKRQPAEKTPLVKVAPDGRVSPFIPDAPYSASAIISRDGHWLYWATSVHDGAVNHQQQLLRAPIP
jgi:hypothetical protein